MQKKCFMEPYFIFHLLPCLAFYKEAMRCAARTYDAACSTDH